MKGTLTGMADLGGRFEMLPENIYWFEITDIEEGKSKNDDPQIGITLTVFAGEHKGKTVKERILISSNPNSPGWKIRWRAKQFLKAIGEPHHGDSFEWDTDRWLFKECQGRVFHEEQKFGNSKGKSFAKIKEFAELNAEQKAQSLEKSQKRFPPVDNGEMFQV